MPGVRTAALVGATGGAGTTRTVVELAALLAQDGERVAILDAAFETQGLAQYVDGRIDPDVTRLLVDDAALADATVPLGLDQPGAVAAVPARAPFERLARAKAPTPARAFEDLLAEVASQFDRVLVDAPPLASNQAVAAVNAVERVVPVVPAGARGTDALQRLEDRLADVGVDAGPALAVFGEISGAGASIPRTDATAVADAPACLADEAFGAAVADAAEAVLGYSVERTFEQPGLVAQVREEAADGLSTAFRDR
jgi:cellulose biosynthesis protein BcsQ